jgi:endonuclease YncB( thermonuclease family)
LIAPRALDSLWHLGNASGMRSLPLVILALILLPLRAAEPVRTWERWEGCTLLVDHYYDGDSFQVKYGNKPKIIRLYGADAPETDAGLGTRLDEQAAYFGVKTADVLRAGSEAKEFTANFLRQPFQVITRRQIAPGASRSERYYALAQREGVSLDAALISAGLARATSEAAAYPDAAAGQNRTLHLRGLEAKARQERKGLWSKATSTSALATLKEQLTPRFLKPQALPAPRLVNLNTAGTFDLEALPGVGAKTAQQIIRARPLKDLAALDAIPGFGPKKIAALREMVSF